MITAEEARKRTVNLIAIMNELEQKIINTAERGDSTVEYFNRNTQVIAKLYEIVKITGFTAWTSEDGRSIKISW